MAKRGRPTLNVVRISVTIQEKLLEGAYWSAVQRSAGMSDIFNLALADFLKRNPPTRRTPRDPSEQQQRWIKKLRRKR